MRHFLTYIFMTAAVVFALCACQPTGDDIVLEILYADPSALQYDYQRQTVRLNLDCNRSWKASTSSEWIDLQTKKGSAEEEAQQFVFVLSGNPDYTYRTAEVVIKAGTKDLVLKVTQEPEFRYLLQENFDHPNVYVFADLPSGWTTLDDDKDGRNWRSYRDSETNKTYAYSASFDYDREWDLTPDNYMASPLFTVPVESFSVKWDVQAYDAEYLGDKYEVWVGTIVDRIIYLAKKVYEGVTTSATEPTHCEVSLDEYKDLTICIVFRHYDSSGLSAILISNVEVSNRH